MFSQQINVSSTNFFHSVFMPSFLCVFLPLFLYLMCFFAFSCWIRIYHGTHLNHSRSPFGNALPDSTTFPLSCVRGSGWENTNSCHFLFSNICMAGSGTIKARWPPFFGSFTKKPTKIKQKKKTKLHQPRQADSVLCPAGPGIQHWNDPNLVFRSECKRKLNHVCHSSQGKTAARFSHGERREIGRGVMTVMAAFHLTSRPPSPPAAGARRTHQHGTNERN